MSIYLYPFLSISIYFYVFVYISIYFHTCLYISIYFYVFLCISMYFYIFLSISIHVYIFLYIPIYFGHISWYQWVIMEIDGFFLRNPYGSIEYHQKSWPACRILCHYLKNDGLHCLNTHQNTLKPSKICGWSPRNGMLHQGTSGLPASPSTTPKFLAQAGSFRVFQHAEVQSSLGWHLLDIYLYIYIYMSHGISTVGPLNTCSNHGAC